MWLPARFLSLTLTRPCLAWPARSLLSPVQRRPHGGGQMVMTGHLVKRPRQPGLVHSSALVMVAVPRGASRREQASKAEQPAQHPKDAGRRLLFLFPTLSLPFPPDPTAACLTARVGVHAGRDGMGWAGLSTQAGLAARRVSDVVRRTVAGTVDVVDVGGLGFFEFQQGRRTTCLRGMDADDDDDGGSEMRGGLATAGWLTSLLGGFLWKCQKASLSWLDRMDHDG
ncbi:uncharacterized protein J3D65DRAFT_600252 [Phyllosticta citribraziliensis]|uniref:Uncharacterized protein n=1 Tax=Phyllosticta citribraziliensis TaxID=989973 RepID=A0ABR1M658_9PEZI